jgi:HEAT repeat protein
MSQSGTPLESLLTDLASPNFRVRWKAVQGLGELRDTRAFEPLLGALRDRLPTIRIAALSGLGRLRDRRAIEPAIALLDDPDGKVRTSAAAALKKFGKEAHAPMLAAYRAGNTRVRFVLLSALGRIKTPAISELLIAALDDPHVEIRMEAARVLGVRKDRRAVPRLLQAVAEGGSSQAFHIQLLGEIGDPRAFEPLQALLATPEFMLGQQVVIALRKIDNARAVDLFHEQLEELPAREGDRLARTLAGTDLLNAALSLARKARASGDTATLSQAFGAAQAAMQEHRARLEAIQKTEKPGGYRRQRRRPGRRCRRRPQPRRLEGRPGRDPQVRVDPPRPRPGWVSPVVCKHGWRSCARVKSPGRRVEQAPGAASLFVCGKSTRTLRGRAGP